MKNPLQAGFFIILAVARDPSALSCPLFFASRTLVRFGKKAGQSKALESRSLSLRQPV